MSTPKIPSRFTWAADIMQIQPTASVLELGCGVGFLVHAIAQKLTSGSIVAIDRSEKMITVAKERNAAFLSSGTASLYSTSFHEFDTLQQFDCVVAFNLSLLYTGDRIFFEKLKAVMKSDALLYVFYQPPGNIHSALVRRIEDTLRKNNLIISRVLLNELISPAVICVQASI